MASRPKFTPPSERILVAFALLWGVLTVLAFEEAFGQRADAAAGDEKLFHATQSDTGAQRNHGA